MLAIEFDDLQDPLIHHRAATPRVEASSYDTSNYPINQTISGSMSCLSERGPLYRQSGALRSLGCDEQSDGDVTEICKVLCWRMVSGRCSYKSST